MKAAYLLAAIGLLVLLGGGGAAAFFFGGFFSVAATNADPGIVNWSLVHVREASIARHATDQPPGSLDDPALVRAGAEAYSQLGCVNCHGGPGVKPASFSKGLNPAPNLKAVINDITPQELFWVVNNGIKMTGMPSFNAHNSPERDHQIWTIVAFLKRVPIVSDEDFKTWTESPLDKQLSR